MAQQTPGYSEIQPQITKKLHRIEGQVKGINRMVKDDRYCIDILTQVSAAQAALGRVAMDLLNEHTLHCVINSDQETQQQRHQELMKTIRRLSKQG
jgi:DNA-binding FrmR family transcriptional regulator